MNEADTKIKFWALLAVVILGVSIAVMFVDISIKTAILAESNRLKIAIWDYESRFNGQAADGPNASGNNTVNRNDSPLPGDLLAFNATGMEEGNVSKRDSAKAANNGRVSRRPSTRTPRGRDIPERDKPMGGGAEA